MVFFHSPLPTEAEEYRQAMVNWTTTQVQPQTDYTLDAKGNRVYRNEKIAPLVIPLMRAMGFAVCKTNYPAVLPCHVTCIELTCLKGWGFTVWRFSAHTMVDPAFSTDIYFIPLNVLGGQPAIVQNGRRHIAVPSWYTVTLGSFETTPEFDCLLTGNIMSGQDAHMFNCT